MEARQAAAAAANQRQEQDDVDEQPAQYPREHEEEEEEDQQQQEQRLRQYENGNAVAREQAGTAEPERTREIRRAADQGDEPAVSLSSSASAVKFLKKPSLSPKTEEDSALVFPALYRVVRERGTEVWNVDNSPPSVVRRLPFGVVVFGRDMQRIQIKGETVVYVEIPDGWVMDDAVLRVYDDLDPVAKKNA